MTKRAKSKLRKLVWLDVIVGLWINFSGATLTFIYFNFIESGLQALPHRLGAGARIIVFFLIAAGVTVAISVVALKRSRSMGLLLEFDKEDLDPERLESLRSHLMNMPFRTAARSAVGWLVAGIIFAILQLLVQESTTSIYPSVRIFIAIVFIGAPFTIITAYFALEWWVRRKIQVLFPEDALVALPKSARINVLPKMLVASLLTGIVPVSMVSYITLSEIHEIQAGRLAMSEFLSQMPLVIGFLLALSLAISIRLSTFVAQSVSEPLRQISSAMGRISKGDLNLSVAVVSNDEIGSLADGFNKMARGLQERDFIRSTFGSYVSPEVAAEILKSPDALNIGGESRDVTILIADLRGFTALAASVSAEAVVRLLNHYFERMIDVIMMYGGTVDELMGDGILAFFGAPKQLPDSPLRAVQCAIEMQVGMVDLNTELKQILPELYFHPKNPSMWSAKRTNSFLTRLSMGIAINSGSLIVGNLGSDKRKKYGAVGSAINVAFRVEKYARGDEIVVTSDVYSRVADVVEAAEIPNIEVKGIDTPVSLYKIIGIKKEIGIDL